MATVAINADAVQQAHPQERTANIAFRFCFLYFGLYCLGTQIVTSLFPIPKVDIPDLSTFWPMRPMVLWCAAHVFHVSPAPSFQDTGSGDRMFDYVLVFCLVVISALATTVWSLVDRKRDSYVRLAKWFRVFIRFALAGQMITYGLSKAIPMQMPFPFLKELIEPFGNMSPMGVLWSSIGASPAYETFAGCAELFGGILLIFPRTTTLGALVCLADMIQVFTLNMTYDVPVKLLSFHLILLSLFLLAPECLRLMNFFFLNRTAEPSAQPALFQTPRANRIAFATQILFGIWLLGMGGYGSWTSWHEYGGGREKSALYGLWAVDQFSIDGQLRPPLLTDKDRWRTAIFDFPAYVSFQRMDDSFAPYGVTIDTKGNALALTKGSDKNWHANLTYQRSAPDHLMIEGSMDAHQIHAEFHLIDRNKFLIVSRGFHWIQEYPFNR
jgi:uncharacterized membrane protein YphA (DoxX/SURF4 family)